MRLTISEFAQLVGLAPSALRFYDDCGVLPPAAVDASNGYRYYSPDQQPRARLLRDLRELDLPLPDVRTALDAPPADVAELVRSHLRTLEAKSTATRSAATRLLTQLLTPRTTTVLGGPELSSALRQVTPAARRTDEPATPPSPVANPGELKVVLGCVLIELSPDEVTFVATDRYRLAIRGVRPVEFEGVGGRVLVRADELAGLIRWAAAADRVRVEVEPGELVRLVAGEDVRELPAVPGEYPAYQGILEGLMPPVCRVVVERVRLLGALRAKEVVAFDIDPSELRIDGDVKLDVIGSGSARIGFTARLLAGALEASVGPDVLLEICAQDRPVVVRSADQGTFTTLVMPVRLDE
ncbi:MerR family transcriptional regulator [Kribbella sp. NPDC026611]|uniref:MerR family transcriptional regulator n=1 Tax=Kribbella sp. NPDC026611 TaxID=3154911 RepID=UPI0033D57BB2